MYVCDDFAKKLYSPLMDPSYVQLNSFTTGFDNCGFIKWDSTGTISTKSDYSSSVTTTA